MPTGVTAAIEANSCRLGIKPVFVLDKILDEKPWLCQITSGNCASDSFIVLVAQILGSMIFRMKVVAARRLTWVRNYTSEI